MVAEDPVAVVVAVGSSILGLTAAPVVVSDDTDGLDGVAAGVSSSVVVFLGSDASLLSDDDVLVCLSLSVADDAPALVFESEADELLLLADDADPPLDAPPDADAPPVPLLDDPSEPESSACATPAPLASAIPSVTAPTPNHL